jgi:flagellar biosynthesis protein FlhF
LAKFLGTPKLEVIAEKGGRPEEKTPDVLPVAPPAASKSAVQAAYERIQKASESNEDQETQLLADDVSRILQRGGFSDRTLARLKACREWPEITKHPMRKALQEVAALLTAAYDRNPRKPLEPRVAFIGTSGVGKTTVLCKQLAFEVMNRRKHPAVFKVDLEKANPGDGLAAFCEVLGVPMFRSVAELADRRPDHTLYVDVPGVNIENSDEIVEVFDLLERLAVTSRVLVINAVYDASCIKRAYRLGAVLGATHVIFSHMDEVTEWGKLWDFVLAPELTPLFLSSGQNIGSGYSEDVLETILEHSFPGVGKEPAMHASAL